MFTAVRTCCASYCLFLIASLLFFLSGQSKFKNFPTQRENICGRQSQIFQKGLSQLWSFCSNVEESACLQWKQIKTYCFYRFCSTFYMPSNCCHLFSLIIQSSWVNGMSFIFIRSYIKSDLQENSQKLFWCLINFVLFQSKKILSQLCTYITSY